MAKLIKRNPRRVLKPSKWRNIEPDETIQIGDEYWCPFSEKWFPCDTSRGKTLKQYQHWLESSHDVNSFFVRRRKGLIKTK